MPQWEMLPNERRSIRVKRFPWWIFLIIGIVCIATALGFMAFPWAPVGLLSIIIGAGFIAAGISALTMQRTMAANLGSILLIAVGVLAIVFTEQTSNLIVWMFGFGLLFIGIVLLVLAAQSGGSAAGFLLLPAIILLIGGVVTLVWPTFSLTIVAIAVGFVLFVTGVFFISQALALRKLPPTIIQES